MLYPVYGLRLGSPRALCHAPLPIPAEGHTPDIELEICEPGGPLPEWDRLAWTQVTEMVGPDWAMRLATAPCGAPAMLRLYTRDRADECTVLYGVDAARIVIHWRTSATDAEQFWANQSGWILGTVLGYAMFVRGHPTLHASVVAKEGRAVALLGRSGDGKSTLAGALVAAGHSFMADDHLVVGTGERGFVALPGPPHLRLLPPSLAALDERADALPRVFSTEDKRYLDLGHNYNAVPTPLDALYVLTPRDPQRHEVALTPLTPTEALLHLLRQRFGRFSLSPAHSAALLAKLSALVQAVPVKLLHRPHGLDTLPAVVRAIEQDCRVYAA